MSARLVVRVRVALETLLGKSIYLAVANESGGPLNLITFELRTAKRLNMADGYSSFF